MVKKTMSRIIYKRSTPKNLLLIVLAICLLTSCGLYQKLFPPPTAKTPMPVILAEPPIVAEGATPHLISRQFKFTEGPAVDKDGNVFFTDQPNDKIWKYDTAGKLTVFLGKSGRANGLYFDQAGNLIACADESNQLLSISPKKKVTVLVKNVKGKKLNGPNDLWINANGDIYFTDPYYQRYYWRRRTSELDGEKLYLLKKGAKEPVIASGIFKKPNGIIGTPDGKYLYVADIDDNKTYRFEVGQDGSLSNSIVFAEQGSDGMTIDNMGNIYLTGIGLTIYNAEGKKVKHIDIDEPWTANVCFGGPNRDKLFITASTALYTLDMKVHGY